ncbi:tyrosine-type recombinase/integrase, partial [Devosia sp.]|uniref:tyrosine-type recombinase/integrase n=1 Tax=Devosia sp. TaxID=1871048 RepID=UPI002736B136
EIAALSLAEVIVDHPVPHFVFRENDSRGLKTVASERKVPIHPVLIELGFIRYVSKQRKLKGNDLFPDLRPNAGTKTSWGDRTHYGFNIAVANALGAARVQNDKNKTFHSFRHYICTELGRFRDLQDKTIQDIVGHENVGTTDRIYKDPTELEVMLEAMCRLPDLTTAALNASSERKIIPARRKTTKAIIC